MAQKVRPHGALALEAFSPTPFDSLGGGFVGLYFGHGDFSSDSVMSLTANYNIVRL